MNPAAAYWLYAASAVGAIALFCLLPRRQSRVLVGGALGAVALASLMFVLGLRVATAGTSAFFYVFAAIGIASAVRVITHTKPVYSALYFILVVVSVTALLVLLGAEFLAGALIIVYAGAILVTYLFVIMLAQQSGAPAYDRAAREPFWAVAAGFLFLATVVGHAGQLPPSQGAKTVPVAARSDSEPRAIVMGNTAEVGTSLMTRYIVGVELSGLLLLISMIGAIALARKRLPAEGAAVALDLGRAGREVNPF